MARLRLQNCVSRAAGKTVRGGGQPRAGRLLHQDRRKRASRPTAAALHGGSGGRSRGTTEHVIYYGRTVQSLTRFMSPCVATFFIFTVIWLCTIHHDHFAG
eukprot:SAG11_NODE_9008_length_954_cov_1.029240_2_plen_101_part_00